MHQPTTPQQRLAIRKELRNGPIALANKPCAEMPSAHSPCYGTHIPEALTRTDALIAGTIGKLVP